jgi:acetolactate decarboxylase
MNVLSLCSFFTISFLILSFQTGFVYADRTDSSSTVYQISSWAPFESGKFSGVCSLNDLKDLGTLGTGGYEDMNGELLELDGVIWQITRDGIVSEPPGNTRTCFATTVKFEPTISYTLNKTRKRSEVIAIINNSFPDHDSIYACRIDGIFSHMDVRSIPKQEEPYPPLYRVIENQSVFNLSEVTGTIVGFWFPQWMHGVNYGGFHLHFITSSHDAGGHVLDFTAENITISIQPLHRFTMILPTDEEKTTGYRDTSETFFKNLSEGSFKAG